jgi:predicted deacylase
MRRLKRRIKFIKTFEGVDLSKRRTPLMVLKSPVPGPVLWLCGAVHGDEVTGIEVIHRLFEELEAGVLRRGTIYAIPVMNPLGFEMVSRVNPYDDEDLNRQFPGNGHGSTAERMAARIFSLIVKSRPDFVVDLHTDSSHSVAYAIVDRPDKLADETALRKAVGVVERMDLPWAFDYSQYAGYPLEKSLSGSLLSHGVPACTLELGGPYIIDQRFVEKGLAALHLILDHFGMMKYSLKPLQTSFAPKGMRKPLRFLEEIRSEKSGLVVYWVRPGQVVKRGEILAKVKNALGKNIEIIRAPQKVLVLSLADQSVSFPGSDLFTLAVEDKKSKGY